MLRESLALCLLLVPVACQGPAEDPSNFSAATTTQENSVEVIMLEYASAEELAQVLNDFVDDATGSAESTIRIVAEPRGNSLLITAPEKRMAELKELIVMLDRPVQPE